VIEKDPKVHEFIKPAAAASKSSSMTYLTVDLIWYIDICIYVLYEVGIIIFQVTLRAMFFSLNYVQGCSLHAEEVSDV